MAFTKKIAGWIAGRIKGEQARKDTMRWMEKTGLGQVLDIAGDIALTQGAIKGVSGLKGLMTGQKAAQAGQTAATASTAKALPEGVTEVGRLASANPAESRALVGQMTAPGPLKPLVAPGAGTTTIAPRTAQMVAPPGVPTTQPMAAIGARPAAAIVPPSAPTTMPRTLPSTPVQARPAMAVTPPAAPSTLPQTIRMATPPSAPGPVQSLMTGSIPEPTMPMRPMGAPGASTTAVGQRVAGAVTPPPVGAAPGITPTAIPEPGPMRQVLGAVGRGAQAIGRFGRENAAVIGATAPAVANVVGAKIEQDIEEEKVRREQEARNRLAMLLMPMFQAQIGQAAPSFQPRG